MATDAERLQSTRVSTPNHEPSGSKGPNWFQRQPFHRKVTAMLCGTLAIGIPVALHETANGDKSGADGPAPIAAPENPEGNMGENPQAVAAPTEAPAQPSQAEVHINEDGEVVVTNTPEPEVELSVPEQRARFAESIGLPVEYVERTDEVIEYIEELEKLQQQGFNDESFDRALGNTEMISGGAVTFEGMGEFPDDESAIWTGRFESPIITLLPDSSGEHEQIAYLNGQLDGAPVPTIVSVPIGYRDAEQPENQVTWTIPNGMFFNTDPYEEGASEEAIRTATPKRDSGRPEVDENGNLTAFSHYEYWHDKVNEDLSDDLSVYRSEATFTHGNLNDVLSDLGGLVWWNDESMRQNIDTYGDMEPELAAAS